MLGKIFDNADELFQEGSDSEGRDVKPTLDRYQEGCPVFSLSSTGLLAKDFEELLEAVENVLYVLRVPKNCMMIIS